MYDGGSPVDNEGSSVDDGGSIVYDGGSPNSSPDEDGFREVEICLLPRSLFLLLKLNLSLCLALLLLLLHPVFLPIFDADASFLSSQFFLFHAFSTPHSSIFSLSSSSFFFHSFSLQTSIN